MSIPRWAKIPSLIALIIFLGGGCSMCLSPGWGFFIMGTGLLAVFSLAVCIHYRFLKRAHHADGTIIAHKEESSSPGHPRRRFLIVSYTLPDGQQMTFQTPTFHSQKSLPVSTSVAVLYDPDQPERAIINRPFDKYRIFLAIPCAIGLLVFGIHLLLV
jgi:hypothetical protein